MKRKDEYKTFVFKERAQDAQIIFLTKSRAESPLSIEPEVDLNVDCHCNRFSQTRPWFEFILLHGLDRLFVQTHPQPVHYLHLGRVSLGINDRGDNTDALILRPPGLFRVFRIRRKDQLGRSDISSYMVDLLWVRGVAGGAP